MAIIQYPSGHVVSFPESLQPDQLQAAASNVWNHIKNAAGAVSESVGGPSSIQQAKDWTNQLVNQSPTEDVKQAGQAIAQTPKSMLQGQADLLEKAKQSWKQGDHVGAATHFVNYMLPLIGQLSDKSGEELKQGDYGKGVGHAIGAVLPIVLGEAAKGESAPDVVEKPTPAAETKAPAPSAPASASPMTPVDRTAAAFLRRIGADRSADRVEYVGGQASDNPITGKTSVDMRANVTPSEDDINAFVKKQFGDAAPQVQIVKQAKPSITSGDISAASNQAIKDIQSRPGYKPNYSLGDAQKVGENIEHPILKDGQPVGIVNAKIDPSTGHATINWVGSKEMTPDGPLSNQLGLDGVKSIKNAFEEAHPEVTKIQGIRIGGARGNEARSVSVPATPKSLDLTDEVNQALGVKDNSGLSAGAAKILGVAAGALTATKLASAKDKKPGKYDVKPRDGAPEYPVITADDKGVPMPLKPEQEQQIRDIIRSYSPDQYPVGGLIVVPEARYKEIQMEIRSGRLFGQPVAQSKNSTEHWGYQSGNIVSSQLGDGFTIPQVRRTYINAALLKNPKRLDEVLAHELGHHAANFNDTNHPDASEEAADEYKSVYMKRGKQTRQTWEGVKNLPAVTPSRSELLRQLGGQ